MLGCKLCMDCPHRFNPIKCIPNSLMSSARFGYLWGYEVIMNKDETCVKFETGKNGSFSNLISILTTLPCHRAHILGREISQYKRSITVTFKEIIIV
jgi:hypothetical protein